MSFLRRASDRPRTYNAAVLLILVALLLGGASRLEVIGSLGVTLTALAVAAYLAWVTPAGRLTVDRGAAWLIAGALALPIVQLIPLPYALWSLLPGRDFAEQVYAAIGARPWSTVSLTPQRTAAALFALIAPVVAFVAVSQLEARGRRNVALAIVAVAGISAMLSVIQMAAGPGSAFRFYAITTQDAGVGLFANPNHHGLFLAVAMVMLFGWLGDQFPRRGPFPVGALIGAASLAALYSVGILLTGSRAGVGFLFVAAIGGAIVMPFERLNLSETRRGPAITLAVVGALVIAGALALVLSSNAGQQLLATRDDGRLGNVPLLLRIAFDMFPFGSGLGSFDAVFRSYETPDTLTLNYLNQAHNDPAQLLIEGGLGGLAFMALGMWWIASRGRAAWAGGLATFESNRLPRVAIVAVTMMLAHSLVDYPMRTQALAVVFAVVCAMLTDAPETERRRKRRD